MDHTITLKKLSEPEDFDLLLKWRNDNKEYFINKRGISRSEHAEWVSRYSTDLNTHQFMVLVDNVTVGTLGYTKIDRDLARIERVMLGDKEYAHSGVMSKALQQMMEQLKYSVYGLYVLNSNEVAIKFYLKNGFRIVKELLTITLMEKI